MWLWCRPAAAAPIQPLAWELPHVAGAALKRQKKKKKKTGIREMVSRSLGSLLSSPYKTVKTVSFLGQGLSTESSSIAF